METESVAVIVPEGIGVGDTFVVHTEWGGSFEIMCPEGSAPGDRVEVELPTVAAAAAQVDTMERVRQFIEGDDQGFMQKIEAFCVEHAARFGDREEVRQSSAEEIKEYPLEYQEVSGVELGAAHA